VTSSSGAAPDAALLSELYAAAVAAVAPGPALVTALERSAESPAPRVWIIALGKASMPMAEAAVGYLGRLGREPVGGLVVAPASGAAPHPAIAVVQGDHPEPGPGSARAADELGGLAVRIAPADEVWVLLSGGTSSLIGAPVNGLHAADLTGLYALLLGSGLDISAMNRIRKRFTRWGAGRLAAALAPARVRCFAISDVIGDDLAAIGSGPCVPDPTTALEVRRLLEAAGLWEMIAAPLRTLVEFTERGEMAETPKPGDPVFSSIHIELIASNRLAVEAAARRAAELGLVPVIQRSPLAGEASTAGASVAAILLKYDGAPGSQQPGRPCLIWGGETVVSLGGATGLGGRCQELALAAARALEGAAPGFALLAAGTDGRDGPTDAAGAIVDGRSWRRIMEAGRDPARDLAAHDAYPALEAAGALLKPGLTGTNVMDVVIGIGRTAGGR
jgi:glycerate 2-kinase